MISLRLASALLACVAAAVVTGPLPAAAAPVPVGSPSGRLDTATVATGGRVTVTGWAVDADTPAPVRVSVVLDGGAKGTTLAAGRRDDVARVYPSYGALRGYRAVIIVPAGAHTVCTDAVNVGPGANRRLGCRVVTVPGVPVKPARPPATRAPIGHLDAVGYSAGAFTVRGWSLDPDTLAPNLVDVTVNGIMRGSVVANAYRPDVARVYPRFGRSHGLLAAITMPATPGNYYVCVTAINTAAGPGKQLGCRLVTVAPNGEPAVLGTATAATAAAAIQAQAIASGAAKTTDFPAGASSAARLAIAVRALLQQAVGLRPPPPSSVMATPAPTPSPAPTATPTATPQAGIPGYVVVTTTRPVDEQAVMGRTPYLGSYPPARTGGRTGPAHALEHYANDPLPSPSAAGDGLVGAAPVLPANGTTVLPVLPGYPMPYTKLRAELAVDAALSQLGVPYVWAAAGPNSFDCSGLTQWAWAKAGVGLYHYTVTQSTQGVRVLPNQLLPGDLVLFGSSLHHVGMYLGAGYMIDAPYTGAYVRIDKIAAYGDFTLAVRP